MKGCENIARDFQNGNKNDESLYDAVSSKYKSIYNSEQRKSQHIMFKQGTRGVKELNDD